MTFTAPVAEPQRPPASDAVCLHCSVAPPEPGYTMPLCARCRDALAQRPFPRWIRLGAVAAGVLTCVSLMSFPRSFAAGVAMERGERGEARGRFAQAGDEYRKVLRTYPQSTDVLVRLAVTEYRAGHYQATWAALDALEGHELPAATYDSLMTINRQVRAALSSAK
jgi:hypothetical protein